MMDNNKYYRKFIKYKHKYLSAIAQNGGVNYNIGVYIGRFQPLHIGHLNIIKKGITDEDLFIIIIGSIDKINENNPFSFEMRKDFIEGSLTPQEREKIKIFGLRDSTQNDIDTDKLWWYKQVKQIIDSVKIQDHNYIVSLYGSDKDIPTTEYLQKLNDNSGINNTKIVRPQHIVVDGNPININATDIRKILNDVKKLKLILPEYVSQKLLNIIH